MTRLQTTVVPAASGQPKNIWLIAHGLGDSHAGWLPAVPYLQPSPDTMVILVDAPEPYGQGFCWYLVPEFSHSHADREDMLAGVATSRELLLETILAEAEAHGLPPSRWCLIGFSQGCTMVLEAALRGVAFAGVIGISGFLPTLADYPAAFGAAAQQTPLLITHGRFDPVVPFERGELMFQTLKGLGCQVEFGAYNKEHSLDPENEVPHLRAFLQAHG